jgi:hypothetical protein
VSGGRGRATAGIRRGEGVKDAGSRFAKSSQPAGLGRVGVILGALAAVALSLSLLAGSAGAATIHVPDTSFDLKTLSVVGQNSQARAIAVDEVNDYVYVMAGGGGGFFTGDIERLDAEGNPVNFPGSAGRNETQSVQFTSFGATDKYTLTCPNGETTAEIAKDPEAEITRNNAKAALEAKCGAGFTIGGGFNSISIEFVGAFAESNVPKTICTATTGPGTCTVTQEINGADELNVIDTTCGSSCMDMTVDNSGGPNQGVLYVSTSGSQTSCCPTVPNDESGGVHVYLPSGQKVGAVHTRSQDAAGLFSSYVVKSCGVAVDDNGDLVVAHGGGSLAFAYFDKLAVSDWETSPDLDPPILGTIASDHTNGCKSDVDSEDNVYDTAGGEPTFSSGPLRKYPAAAFELDPNPSGEEFKQPSKVPSQTLATGSHVDNVLDEEGNIITFLTNGELKKWSTENGSPIEGYDTALVQPSYVARNNSLNDGTLYVTDNSGAAAVPDVWIFKSLVVPDSNTGGFTPDTATTATLDGDLDPAGGGEVLTCEFELVNQTKFQATGFGEAAHLPCDEGNTFTNPEDVSVEVTSGLTLEQQHHFRLRTTNANGQSLGSIHRFTPHAVVEIATQPATDVAPRSATLNASFNGKEEPTSYYFKWGPNAGLGQQTTPINAGEPSGPTDISDQLEGLDLEKTYFYRIVATNSQGTSEGETLSFKTLPAVSSLVTKPASSLDQEDITLNAEYDGDNLETTYYFEYGFDTSYGNNTPEETVGPTSGPTPLSAVIDEFNGFKTYHYRIVAENSFGKSFGQDETFTAPDPLNPGIQNTVVSSITPTTAAISAEVNPNHWETIYLFEWGKTTAYGNAVPFSLPIGGLDNEPIAVGDEMTGLEPGTIYHARAVAMNFKGTTEGEDITFITPDLPRIDSAFANAVGQTTAHLGGSVAARASSTNVSFQYGPTAAYGSTTPAVPIGSDLLPRDVAADIAGLVPGTTYHYRVVATNDVGTVLGPDQTFTTTAPPVVNGPKEDCGEHAREAKKLKNKAKSLRRKAKKTGGKEARKMRKRAKGLEKRAKKANREARACRGATGENGK